MICKTFKLTWIWTCKIPVMHDFLLQTLTLAERKQSESVVFDLALRSLRQLSSVECVALSASHPLRPGMRSFFASALRLAFHNSLDDGDIQVL